MLIKKVKNTIAVVAKVVQNLTNNSETDVPSVKAVKDAITTTIVTGEEYETGRVIDGKKEYGKRINFGALPNNTAKEVDIGLTNIVFTKAFEVIAYKSGVAISLPLVSATAISSNIYIAIINNKINITTKADYSSYTNCFVDIYYSKTEGGVG